LLARIAATSCAVAGPVVSAQGSAARASTRRGRGGREACGQYSDTVPRPTPHARAMARWGRRWANFSRRISRTCLIRTLSVMWLGPSRRVTVPKGRRATDERSGPESAIAIPGLGDHDASEPVIRIERNA